MARTEEHVARDWTAVAMRRLGSAAIKKPMQIAFAPFFFASPAPRGRARARIVSDAAADQHVCMLLDQVLDRCLALLLSLPLRAFSKAALTIFLTAFIMAFVLSRWGEGSPEHMALRGDSIRFDSEKVHHV